MNVGSLPVRSATSSDADEIVRLASVMFTDAGMDASDATWRNAAFEGLHRRLGRDLRVFVVEHPDRPGTLISQTAGIISERLPDPSNIGGQAGYVLWTVTDREWRSRGLASKVMVALLDWFDSEKVPGVELHTTAEGRPLYTSLGFSEGMFPGLRRVNPSL